jgi:hypothetical protein
MPDLLSRKHARRNMYPQMQEKNMVEIIETIAGGAVKVRVGHRGENFTIDDNRLASGCQSLL